MRICRRYPITDRAKIYTGTGTFRPHGRRRILQVEVAPGEVAIGQTVDDCWLIVMVHGGRWMKNGNSLHMCAAREFYPAPSKATT